MRGLWLLVHAAVFRPDRAGRFIDAAHAAGLRIVAWYLPSFLSVKTDARKALAAIRFRSANGDPPRDADESRCPASAPHSPYELVSDFQAFRAAVTGRT